MAAKLEVHQDTTGRWRFRVRSGTGEIMAHSAESYREMSAAKRAAGDMRAAVSSIGAAYVLNPKQPTIDKPVAPAAAAHCQSAMDGDCDWIHCPQLRDGEPKASGRDCPLQRRSDEEL